PTVAADLRERTRRRVEKRILGRVVRRGLSREARLAEREISLEREPRRLTGETRRVVERGERIARARDPRTAATHLLGSVVGKFGDVRRPRRPLCKQREGRARKKELSHPATP